jgi:hypothetical protein
MAANRGLEGRINQIASRPTDPNIEAQLDRIRTAEAIHASGNGQELIPFLNRLTTTERGPAGWPAVQHADQLQVRIAQAKSNYDAALMGLVNHLTGTGTMLDLIKGLKRHLAAEERVANPRRLQLLGAISHMHELPGTTTSHPTDPKTGAVLERNAAGGPTALIAQMLGTRPDGSALHVRTSRPPPGPPGPEDDLYTAGRRRTRRRRHTRRR